jgi:hypothetical protein
MKFSGKIFSLVLFFQTTFCFFVSTFAQSNPEKKRFYVGIDGGFGLLKIPGNDFVSGNGSCFSLGFYGGYTPFNWLRTGINVNGWLIESFGNFSVDPERGISISNTYVQAQVFPFKKINLFINLAGGFSNYINHHSDEYNEKGSGALFGLGYEKDFFKNVGVSFVVNYGFGKFKHAAYLLTPEYKQQYHVTEFLIGITYHLNNSAKK